MSEKLVRRGIHAAAEPGERASSSRSAAVEKSASESLVVRDSGTPSSHDGVGPGVQRTRVVAYVRVSTIEQATDGVSLAAQRAKVEAFCTAMDLELVSVIEDAGASAKSLDREGLRRALGLLRSGAAEGLLVAKLDRLTRSVRDLGELVDDYFASRFALLSVGDSIDTRSAAGRLVLNVLTSVGQWEREAIGERTSQAMQHMRSEGRFTGGLVAPYGFTANEGQLVPVEREQAVIAVARELHRDGLSLRAIASELARRELRSRTDRVFDAQQVRRMLSHDRAAFKMTTTHERANSEIKRQDHQ